MATHTTGETLARQWEMLKMLPTHATGKPARELTEQLNALGFTVSKRQVERDLQELSRYFPLLCNDKSKPYGWSWQATASAELPSVSLAESLSLTMIEQVIRPLLPGSVLKAIEPRLQQARRKLEKYHTLSNWTRKVAHVSPNLPQQPPAINDEVLANIQYALLYELQVEVNYQSIERSEPKRYFLHPLGLVQRNVTTYVVGRVEPYPDVRLFALHRMQTATLTELKATESKDFSLKKYLASGGLQFSDGDYIDLCLNLHPSVVHMVEEAPLTTNQVITNHDNYSEFKARVINSWQLQWWLLSLGELVEIKAPYSLRQTIANRLKQAARQYD